MNLARISKTAQLTGLILWLFSCSFYASAQEVAVATRYRLSLPEKKWALDVTLPTVSLTRSTTNLPQFSFVDPTESFAKNGDALLLALQSRKGSDLSNLVIRVQPALRPMAASEFRELVLKRISKSASGIKTWDYNRTPVARYTTESTMAGFYAEYGMNPPSGTSLTSRNLEAFFVKDDVCATLTLTAAALGSDEEKLFYSLSDSVKFVDVSSPTKSFDYYQVGRVLHNQKNYELASKAFDSALRLEQRQPELDPRRWRDLIMKTAEVDVALSNKTAAAETLEYAVGKEPTNTTFLMQLARTYALQGDPTRTLAILNKTFSLMKQEKAIFEKRSGGQMFLPDLNKDPAFKDLMKDSSFRDAVKAMKK